jgi:uncharacterized protein YjbI with pentapeptide repeats
MLVAIGFFFTVQQDARQERTENQRAEAEQELAKQRAHDEALQAYLDQMSTLLLEKDLRNSGEESEVRTLARARTLTVMESLDPSRRLQVVQFLLEAKLIQSVDDRDPIIRLSGANLSGADLSHVDLSGFKFYLSGADLSEADLFDANLSDANLFDANLREADLTGANLTGA